MRKTLNALLTAGLIGASGLLPLKKSEAQDNISVFTGGGSPPLQDMTFNLRGLDYDLDFQDTQIFGFRFGHRVYWEAKVNPSWEIEGYISQNQGEKINYASFNDSAGACEFGEKTVYGHTQCRKLNRAVLRMISVALLGSVEIRPSQRINRLAIYAGGGPFVRWSWFSLLDETAEKRNYGLEFQLGVRWRLEDYNDSAEIFLEYDYDKSVPNFSNQRIHDLITLNSTGTDNGFHRTLLGARAIF